MEHGGQNKEKIYLTPTAFKRLCLLANTEKAKKIHNYYIKLEEMLHEMMIEEAVEMKKQLQLKDREIEIVKEKYANITGKKLYEQPQNECVYIYVPDKTKPTKKIGKAKKILDRQSNYLTGNPYGEIIYIVPCQDSDFIERGIHKILDKYRTINNREWFETEDINFIKNTIHSVVDFFDKGNALEFIEKKCNNSMFDPEIKQELEISKEVKEAFPVRYSFKLAPVIETTWAK